MKPFQSTMHICVVEGADTHTNNGLLLLLLYLFHQSKFKLLIAFGSDLFRIISYIRIINIQRNISWMSFEFPFGEKPFPTIFISIDFQCWCEKWYLRCSYNQSPYCTLRSAFLGLISTTRSSIRPADQPRYNLTNSK